MIRKATPDDIKWIIPVCEAQAETHYPGIEFETAGAKNILRNVMSSRLHLCLVDDQENVLIATSADIGWGRGRQATIQLLTGNDVAMLRGFRDWFNSRPGIKAAAFPAPRMDRRYVRVLARLGFTMVGGLFMLHRSAEPWGSSLISAVQ